MMNVESMVDDLIPYIDHNYFIPQGGRDFPWNVNVHEAGHAIVGNALREDKPFTPRVYVEPETGHSYGIAGITEIEPGETRQGFNASTRGAIAYHPGMERTLIKHCALLLAGLAAEAIAAGMGWRYTLVQRRIAYAGQDAIDCAEYCELVQGWDFRRVALPSWTLAFRILESKWPEVEALAAGIVPTDPPPHVREYFRSIGRAA